MNATQTSSQEQPDAISQWIAQYDDGLTWSEFLARPDLWK